MCHPKPTLPAERTVLRPWRRAAELEAAWERCKAAAAAVADAGGWAFEGDAEEEEVEEVEEGDDAGQSPYRVAIFGGKARWPLFLCCSILKLCCLAQASPSLVRGPCTKNQAQLLLV